MIRPIRSGDEDALLAVFRRSVAAIAPSRYSNDRVNAWLSCGPTEESLRNELLDRDGFVAVDSGEILGWIDLLGDGHIDRHSIAYRRRAEAASLTRCTKRFLNERRLSA